jgi:hypothetical protein
MDQAKREDVQRYLDANYLKLEDLAARAGVTTDRILELVAAQCVPPHSHEVRGVVVFASTFGEFPASLPPERYYHPSLVDWVRKASALARRHTLADVARRMRKDFEQAVETALDGRPPPWPRGVDYAWAYLMDGTWGLCLKEISVASLLQKEFARQTIARLVSPDPQHRLSAAARTALIAAIDAYNAVAADFGPHELADSSRAREVGRAIEKYGLAGEIGRQADNRPDPQPDHQRDGQVDDRRDDPRQPLRAAS